ncbi:hypothetical protein [Bartonella senegalensis]|uniref:hypothetical protein n=1 Tax=Bartonella senegalensis TaxID=1468418 RepID=UPI00031B83AD|nr:hypothetical protein [Bartonella senegalensis]
MTKDTQPQHQFVKAQGEKGTVSYSAFEKESKILSFKDALILSAKDYKIIFCISLLAFLHVFVRIVVWGVVSGGFFLIYSLEFSHMISREQFQGMVQQKLKEIFLEMLQGLSMQQMQEQMIQFLHNTNLNAWEAFLLLLPQILLGYALFLFPTIFLLHIIVNRELKDMIQQLEKAPEQSDRLITPHNPI